MDGCPIQSPDGLSLYMASNRPGGMGLLDIWVARRPHRHAPWGAPENLGEPVNSAADDFCPTPIRGGGLFFVSREALPGSCGLGDIYFTRYTRKHGWSEPQHLGCAPDGPNSALDEQGPSYVETGRRPSLVLLEQLRDRPGRHLRQRGPSPGGTFGPAVPVVRAERRARRTTSSRTCARTGSSSSSPRTGRGRSAARTSGLRRGESVHDPWSVPVNLGGAVNTAAAETRPSLSRNARTLLFGRSPGPEGMSDIYVSTREKLEPLR